MKILYLKISNSPYILIDQEILENNFQCRPYKINVTSTTKYLFAIIKLSFFLLSFGWRYDAYFIRFADWHSAILTFFKKLYRKKLFVVVGGFDVAAIPQFKYGGHVRKYRSLFIKYTLNNATHLLPNSTSMIFYENKFIQNTPTFGGIKHFVPNTPTPITIVHNGFNTTKFQKLENIEKKNLAVTVAVVNSDRTFYMKGVDMFIETAKQLTEYEFHIVGISQHYLKQKGISLPKNLNTTEFTISEKLVELYAEAKVFCLFSLSEGMPNVLCEAMLCECIPVGTMVTSIPEIIADTGFVIQERNISEHILKVKYAFESDNNLGTKARKRIIENYNLKRREEKIVSIIQQS